MAMLIRLAFGTSLCLALLLVTLQFFLSPLYLEMEYEYSGFPPPRAVDTGQRYTASQALLSYLNVENGGATLRSLSELRFSAQPFFNEADQACIFRAKELRGTAFGMTFSMGVAAIALGLFMAADDFTRARRTVLAATLGAFFAYTLLSVAALMATAIRARRAACRCCFRRLSSRMAWCCWRCLRGSAPLLLRWPPGCLAWRRGGEQAVGCLRF